MSPVLPSTTTQSMASEANQKQLVYGCSASQPQGENASKWRRKEAPTNIGFCKCQRGKWKAVCNFATTAPNQFKKKCFHILPCESDYVWSSINLDARKYIERHSLYWLFNHMDSVGRRVQPRHNHPMQTDTHPQNPRSPGSLHRKGIIT